jgi:hypothetical protein
VGTRDARADVRRGSVYDHFGGAGAILFSREASRDRDLFRAVYFDTAEGNDLTALSEQRLGVDRILATHGTGTALLTRPTPAGGAGTIWEGTRILVAGGRTYAAASDTPVDATTTAVTVLVRAADVGPGSAVNLSGSAIGRIDDPLWDPIWQLSAIRCEDGTALEAAADLRARARTARLAARKGYAEAIVSACVEQGAAHVALFDSDATGTDAGLTYCYVAEEGFATSPRLLRACTAVLERHRVCGVDLQVFGMQRRSLGVSAVVALRDDPGRLPGADVALRDALAASFEPTRYDYAIDELVGVLSGASPDVQTVTMTAPTQGASILASGDMPAILTRYELGPVTLQFMGPQ